MFENEQTKVILKHLYLITAGKNYWVLPVDARTCG